MILKPIKGILPRATATVRLTERGMVFNREAARLLKLTESDRVAIMCREADMTDMYIVKAEGRAGYPLRRRSLQYHLNSYSLAREVSQILGVSRGVFPLGSPEQYGCNGDEAVPIITRINYYESAAQK